MTIPSIEASLPGAAELADRASSIAHGGKAVYGARLGILINDANAIANGDARSDATDADEASGQAAVDALFGTR